MLKNLIVLTTVTLLSFNSNGQKDGNTKGEKQNKSVDSLIVAVKNVEKFQTKRSNAKSTMDAVFALAERYGELIGAVKTVVGDKSETMGVAELIKIIQSLHSSTKETDGLVCANAAFALGEFGPVAKNALPTLILLKDNPEKLAKSDAAEAQIKIDKRQ